MNHRNSAGLILLGMLLAVPATAAGLECPASIQLHESLSSAPADGWASRIAAPERHLAGVTLFDGDPSGQASLVPTRDEALAHSGADRVATWDLTGGGATWLACAYQDTGITLVRELPTGYTQCRLTYGPGGVVKAWNCH